MNPQPTDSVHLFDLMVLLPGWMMLGGRHIHPQGCMAATRDHNGRIHLQGQRHTPDGNELLPTIVVDTHATVEQFRALVEHVLAPLLPPPPAPQGGQR